MGVYIKGMEMPKCCADCVFSVQQHGSIVTECVMPQGRGDYCPLIEVEAPHGRLIDANDVNERIRKKLGIRNLDYLLEAEKPIAMNIKESPTVIEAEVE